MSEPLNRLTTALADRYRVERELGQGGMATVYLAHDIRHERDVAIKVLHPDLGAALGSERFLTEIRTTAKLQHPHILPLLDSGEADGLLYYVMPLVTGETLRSRLERERQLPIEDAVRIAREVADALGSAHALGIIHRDIKPENILLQGGHALVADFGIALAVQQAGGQRMTQTGLSLGTPQYMSPEQAMGERAIDARSDIYALGAVTYEMLVGEAPFTGPSVQAIVARLITETPRGLAAQRKAVPDQVEYAVLRALEKLPADRWATARELADALKGDGTGRPTKPLSAQGVVARWQPSLLAVGVAAFALTGVAAWGWLRAPDTTSLAVRRVNVTLPDSAPLEFVGEAPVGAGQTALALSPDGQTLVYVGSGGARPRLSIRALDRFETTPLAGTEGAYNPFFSPDGAWVGFFADNQVKKVSLANGQVSVLADAALSTSGTWTDDGNIEFLTSSGSDLNRVAASGGKATVIAHRRSGGLKTIAFLPGSKWRLCTVSVDGGSNVLIALSPDDKEERVLVRNGAAVAWHDGLPIPDAALRGTTPLYNGSGSLLFTRTDGSLMAIQFDPAQLTTRGEPISVALGIRRESWTGHAQVAVAADGTLAYVVGENSDVGVLAWLGRTGRVDTLPFAAAATLGTDVSPDGQQLAVAHPAVGGEMELWAYDLTTHQRQRLLSGLCSSEVRWTADGQGILICLGGVGLARINPARPGRIDTLVPNLVNPSFASRDGKLLLMGSIDADSQFALSLDGRRSAELVNYAMGRGTFQPSLSPDGRWVAGLGRTGGVFVEPFPVTGEMYRVSGQLEGDVPSWSPSGDELVFPSGSQMYSVAVHPGPPFRFGPPRLIATQHLANLAGRPYAPAPDGQRFLIRVPAAEHSARSIHLVLNGAAAGAAR
ncbi:MAG: protein kinase [Gemmatimonadales bacterium]